METRFKKEPYITQRKGKNGMWTFQVFIRSEYATITKSFSEREYGTARIAYDSAVVFRNRTLIDIADNTILKRNNVTVSEVFEDFIENSSHSLKTKNHHRDLYNKYIKHKDSKLQDLTRADILDDLNKMVEIASDDTIKRVLMVYRNDIIEPALMKDYLIKDISLGIKLPKSRMVSVKRNVTTDRETVLKVEELIMKTVADKYDARVIVNLIETLYYTGMRPAEAEALTKSDIKGDHIYVTKELGSSLDDDNVIRNCKTPSSVRKVPIHPNLRPILREAIEMTRFDDLFRRSNGDYMNSTWVGDVIRRVCKKEGIEFNLYRLRHNMATSLVTNNVDTRTTMEILGHSNYDMSIYYASSNDDLKEDAVKLLS